MEYVVPLEEKQQGVAHRAARYYKFRQKSIQQNKTVGGNYKLKRFSNRKL